MDRHRARALPLRTPRDVSLSPFFLRGRAQYHAFGNLTRFHHAPQRDEGPTVGVVVVGAESEPLSKHAVFWNLRKRQAS